MQPSFAWPGDDRDTGLVVLADDPARQHNLIRGCTCGRYMLAPWNVSTSWNRRTELPYVRGRHPQSAPRQRSLSRTTSSTATPKTPPPFDDVKREIARSDCDTVILTTSLLALFSAAAINYTNLR